MSVGFAPISAAAQPRLRSPPRIGFLWAPSGLPTRSAAPSRSSSWSAGISPCRRPRSCPRPSTSRCCSTTAGMQPFKPYFLGEAKPPGPRLTSVQRCFRAVDIDVVGSTERHMTFFQMMGNFSFGDYFKPGAVEMAYELSTGAFGLDPERIWATVYEGDEQLGPDDVARDLWLAQGIPAQPHRRARRGQLLEGRSDRAVRALLGALLRPRRPARLRRRGLPARLRLRPLPRVLEPRVHGVRPRRRRLADAAAGAEHRHGQRSRARRDAPAGRRQHLRDRPDGARDLRARAALGQALRRRRRRRALVPRALRPRSRDGGDRDRRRHAVQRGSRLRAAPDPPARRAARQPPRARDAVPGRRCTRS